MYCSTTFFGPHHQVLWRREKFDVFQFVCEGLSGQFEMEILVAIN